MARLQHPGIVQIHEVGEHAGHPFCALEFIDGGNLAQKLDGKPLPPREAAHLVEALARAMHLAHSRNVVHRDLKPANILLASSGSESGELIPKVTDFGLARQLDADSCQTQAGAVVGTPSYMAPEQAAGKAHEAGPAADVYALGAILYECLTGQPPFKGATLLETLEQVRTREPAPPSQLAPRESRGANWPDLETICLKCLRKEPEKRYSSAETLAEDLRRYQAGEPITARPVGRLERTAKWVRRNKGLSTGLATAVLALLVGITVATFQAVAARIAADNEAEQRRVAEDERTNAEHLAGKEAAARRTAEDEKKRGDHQLSLAESRLYAAQLAQAQREWQDGNGAAALKTLELCQWNLRDVEFRLLWTLYNSNQRNLLGHTGRVDVIAFSPDGKHIVSGSLDQTVKVWDVKTGQEIVTFRGHKSAVHGVAFSRDGYRIVSSDGDPSNPGEVKVWDAETGKEVLTLKGHTSYVFSVCFSPDGKRIVSGGASRAKHFTEGELKIWDVKTSQVILTLKGHKGNVRCAAFSFDGKHILSCSDDKTLKVWDSQTGEELRTLTGHTYIVTSATFSSDGKRIVSGSGQPNCPGEVKVWDTATGAEVRTLSGHTGSVVVALSSDGKFIVSGSEDCAIRLWDVETGRLTRTLHGHTFTLYCLAISPDGKHIASGGRKVKLWDTEKGQEVLTLNGATTGVYNVAISQDGKRVVSISTEPSKPGELKMQVAETGQEVFTLNARTKSVTWVTFSPDGKRLLSSGDDNVVRVWDAHGKEILEFNGHNRSVSCMAFRPDGKRIVSASSDNILKVWDAATGRELLTLKPYPEPPAGRARSFYCDVQSRRQTHRLERRESSTGPPR